MADQAIRSAALNARFAATTPKLRFRNSFAATFIARPAIIMLVLITVGTRAEPSAGRTNKGKAVPAKPIRNG